MYDYLIVGAGLFGATCANKLKQQGKKVLVIEKRDHVGGNIYTEKRDNINVHVYGAHIFHTSDKEVWDYVNSFVKFNDFVNCPIADFHGERYNLPFNMNTFCQLWPDVHTPEEAMAKIEQEKAKYIIIEPQNLEEQAISLVGPTIYRKLIKEYTEKQWGRSCKELPAFIIKRLPVRFEFNNNYFNDTYQGIPIGGYTLLVEKMLEGIEVRCGVDFLKNKEEYSKLAKKIIYTGPIDEYFGYEFGYLEYRSLKFNVRRLEIEDYQHNAVVNYTSHDVPYTRIIEHKHFENDVSPVTIISEEYPDNWELGKERFYTVNNERNNSLYNRYVELASKENNVVFGGRLGLYKYLDMDDTIIEAFNLIKNLDWKSQDNPFDFIKININNWIKIYFTS